MKQVVLFLILMIAGRAFADNPTFVDDPHASRVGSEMHLQILAVALFGTYDFSRIEKIKAAYTTEELRLLVDQTAIKIFQTKSAQAAFCSFATTPKDARYNFGVFDHGAKELSRICHTAIRDGGYNNADQVLPAERTIYIVKMREESPVGSWTDDTGDIHIFSNGGLTPLEFERALIHEYFIQFDLTEENASRHFNSQSLTGLLQTPVILGTFQMMRALKFETQVLSEQFKTHEQTELPCWDLARSLETEVIPVRDLFRDFGEMMLPSAQWSSAPAKSIEALMEIAKREHITPDICETLSRPRIGLTIASIKHGPRPRLGSGSERTTTQVLPLDLSVPSKPPVNAHDLMRKAWPYSFELKELTKPALTQKDLVNDTPKK